MRRDPGKQEAWRLRSKPLRRTGIRPRSTKQAAKDRELAKARKVVLERDQYTCQLKLRMDGHHCTGSLHVHHIRRRSQGGGNDLSNLVTLCESAHSFVHSNLREAALFGLIRFTEADE